MREAVIVAAVRTPSERNGGLAGVHAVDLSAKVLQALVTRAGPESVPLAWANDTIHERLG